MKRLLVLVSMICIMLSFSAFAEKIEVFTSGDYEYTLTEDGTAEVTKYTGNAEVLEVPIELDGYSVTSIGDQAFNRCESLSSVTLPEGIQSIRGFAFAGCSNLNSITLPEGIGSIEEYAFAGCTSLSSVILPEGIQSIGDSAFKSCWHLSNITLPDGIQSIGNEAFSDCSDLNNISFPEGIKSIGDFVFKYTSLSSIVLPDSIDTMGSNPFYSGVDSISVSPDNPYLEVIDGVLFSKPDSRLIYCPKTKDYYPVPEGIESIGGCAFIGCTNLSSIILPEGIKSIGDEAFGFCSSLSSITLPDSIEEMGSNPFCGGNISINISPDNPYFAVIDGVLFSKQDKRLIFFPDTKEEYVIPDGIQSIGDNAFSECDSLNSITLPEGLTSIGERAFYDCSSLSSVTLPEGVENIASDAFKNCENLILTVPRDSYTAQYCNENDLNYIYPGANEEWECPNCGEMATGNFCSNCGTARDEDTDEEETEETDLSEEPGWKTFDTEVTTTTGYVIKLHYTFSDRWVDSYDTELVDKLFEEVGIHCVDSLSSVQNLGVNPQESSYGEYKNESNPHLKYIFGYLQCDNITDGWDISEDNPQEVHYLIGAAGDEMLCKKSSLCAFYADGTVQDYYSNYSNMRWEGMYQRGSHLGSFVINLKSNQSGNLPFVLAAYSPINPNYPDGDKWYEGVEITVRDYDFYYGGITPGETIFSYIPDS